MTPLRTPAHWLAILHPHLRIMDPDGWRGPNGRPLTDAISQDEFGMRLAYSTVMGWEDTPNVQA